MNNDEKQIIYNMLWLLKDFCEETQCRFCPFHANDEGCQFIMMPDRLTKILERLDDEIGIEIETETFKKGDVNS